MAGWQGTQAQSVDHGWRFRQAPSLTATSPLRNPPPWPGPLSWVPCVCSRVCGLCAYVCRGEGGWVEEGTGVYDVCEFVLQLLNLPAGWPLNNEGWEQRCEGPAPQSQKHRVSLRGGHRADAGPTVCRAQAVGACGETRASGQGVGGTTSERPDLSEGGAPSVAGQQGVTRGPPKQELLHPRAPRGLCEPGSAPGQQASLHQPQPPPTPSSLHQPQPPPPARAEPRRPTSPDTEASEKELQGGVLSLPVRPRPGRRGQGAFPTGSALAHGRLGSRRPG